MTSFISAFLYIILGYAFIGLVQFWVSDYFYFFGTIIGSFKNMVNGFASMLGFNVSGYVFLLYGSLIFVLIFKLLRTIYLTRKS